MSVVTSPVQSHAWPYVCEADPGVQQLVHDPTGLACWSCACRRLSRRRPLEHRERDDDGEHGDHGQPDCWPSPYQSCQLCVGRLVCRWSSAARSLYPWGLVVPAGGNFCGRLGCWRVCRCSWLLLLYCWCQVAAGIAAASWVAGCAAGQVRVMACRRLEIEGLGTSRSAFAPDSYQPLDCYSLLRCFASWFPIGPWFTSLKEPRGAWRVCSCCTGRTGCSPALCKRSP